VLVKSLQSASDQDILREYATRWAFLAHPGQIPPEDKPASWGSRPWPWFCYLMRSGRGGGKTRSGAEWILKRVRQGYRHIALIGQTAADIRDTMVELGPSSIMKVAKPDERPDYEPSKRRLTFPNGAIATTFTGEEPDQLRGPAHDTAWIDELAKFKYPEETWDNMEMGLRLGDNPQVFCTTTPRPIPIIKRLVQDPTTIDVRFSTSQNAENLSPIFLKRVMDRYAGTRLGRQELEGEILDDNPNAMFQRAIIENLRINERECPQLIRVVVGMDPAVTGNKKSDETGIIAGGIAATGHGYVLQDASLRGSPAEWARAGVRTFYARQADRIVGEVNNGGDLIEVNIRTVDRNVPFTAVHASRGKAIRAGPVAGLYEQGRIHHVGTFPQLEDQMCDWQPGDESPDRMDALVWCIWDLFALGVKDEQQQQVYVIRDDTEI
jgi:phage terminase large subunit-like protein